MQVARVPLRHAAPQRRGQASSPPPHRPQPRGRTDSVNVPSPLRDVTKPIRPASAPRITLTASPTKDRWAVGVPSLSLPLPLLSAPLSAPLPSGPDEPSLSPPPPPPARSFPALRAAGLRRAAAREEAAGAGDLATACCAGSGAPPSVAAASSPAAAEPCVPASATSRSGACFRISKARPSAPTAVTHVHPDPLPVTTPTTPAFTRPAFTRTRMPCRASTGTTDSVVPGAYLPPRDVRPAATLAPARAADPAPPPSPPDSSASVPSPRPASSRSVAAVASAPLAAALGAGEGGAEPRLERPSGRPSGPSATHVDCLMRTTAPAPPAAALPSSSSPSMRTRTHSVAPPPGPPGTVCTSNTTPVCASPFAACAGAQGKGGRERASVWAGAVLAWQGRAASTLSPATHAQPLPATGASTRSVRAPAPQAARAPTRSRALNQTRDRQLLIPAHSRKAGRGTPPAAAPSRRNVTQAGDRGPTS
jgi:hypothetical protein